MNLFCIYIVVVFQYLKVKLAYSSERSDKKLFSNSWAVQLDADGTETDVKLMAAKYGLKLMKIFEDYYLLTDKSSPKVVDKPSNSMITNLLSHGKLKWVEQQVLEKYDSRDYSFNDPEWTNGKQRYLSKDSFSHVESVWNRGYTGSSITVAVIDDGLRHSHREFAGRYDESASFDLIDGDDDPHPIDSNHGTACAGVIAAAENNNLCGVGAAFGSRIAAIRLLKSKLTTDALEAKAFYPGDDFRDKIDIFSCSWGPLDNGAIIRGPRTLARQALQHGIEKGRNGLGFIYVFSSGNGGFLGDSCHFDGYTNSIYTISVASVRENGNVPDHSESCGAIMTSVYSGNMVTASNVSDRACSDNFGGTSAAAAFTSGIIALALQANPNLSWRDVQHVIARSSKRDGFEDSKAEWSTNYAGFYVSERFGFGVLDALSLVENAQKWNKSAPAQRKCEVSSTRLNAAIENDASQFRLDVNDAACGGSALKYLEHVELRINIEYTRRGLLSVDVVSPKGTRSHFFKPRTADIIFRAKNYTNLVAMSVHFWGEPSEGQWTLRVANGRPTVMSGSGTLFDYSLIFYGTNDPPDYKDGRNNQNTKAPPSKKSKKLVIWLVPVLVAFVVLAVAAVVILRWYHSSYIRRDAQKVGTDAQKMGTDAAVVFDHDTTMRSVGSWYAKTECV